MINFLKKLWYERTLGAVRSPDWPSVRNEFLRQHPACAICGKTKNVVPHHKFPFHLFPELELDFTNLVSMCESSGMNCHLVFGHFGNFKFYNKNIDEDVKIWKKKLYEK